MNQPRANLIRLAKALGLVAALVSALLIAGCWEPAGPPAGKKDGLSLRPFSYSYVEVKDFLRRQGIAATYPITVRRNRSGTAIFMVFSQVGVPGFKGLTASVSKIDTWEAPAPICFTTGESTVVAWLIVSESDARLEFQGGQHVALAKHALLDVEPEGRYFIVTSEPLETWIGRVKSPEERQLVAAGFRGDRVFAASNCVYVCGTVVTETSPRTSRSILERCYMLVDVGDHFEVIDQQDLPWGAVDMDLSEGRLLLYQNIDPPWGFPRLWVYDMKTGEKVRDGADEGYCRFFLTQDVLRWQRKSVGNDPAAEPVGAADRSQPIRAETNSTSSAAGSRR